MFGRLSLAHILLLARNHRWWKFRYRRTKWQTLLEIRTVNTLIFFTSLNSPVIQAKVIQWYSMATLSTVVAGPRKW